MDLSDVERLDGVLAEGECWHGCILCPGVGDGEPYNLLVQGTVVKFYKSKTGNLQSRQATAGIMIPTAYPATSHRRGMAACTNSVRAMGI